MNRTILLAAAIAATASPLAGQECQGESRSARRSTYCEVREMSFTAESLLEVGGSPNGDIEVVGVAGNEVRVVARVQTHARTQEEARELAEEVNIEAGGSRVRASGPSMRGWRNAGWSVSWTIQAPYDIALDVGTVNGGIRVTGIRGGIEAGTTNGAITLDEVAGRVNAHTTNGSVQVRLAGAPWMGESLEVQTTNGRVALEVPDGFGADLSVRTVNGAIQTDFPVTVQGRIGRQSLNATLGEGGPPVRLTTTNGGVEIRRR